MKQNTIRNVIIFSLIGNIILTAIKLTFGLLGNSNSLVSDGFNSLSDIFVSILILVVLKVSNKTPDKNHPYGHEKYEGVMYLFLSFIILLTGGFLLKSGISNLLKYFNDNMVIIKPESYTMIVAVVALVIKFVLFVVTNKTANKYNSSSLKGDTKNHLYDMLSTSVSLLSIILTQFGLLYFEPIATIIISIFILYSVYEMIKEAVSFLVDEAPKKEKVRAIHQTILNCAGVIKIDDLKTRKHMNHIYVDVEIAVDRNLSLLEAHKIAEDVHLEVEKEFDALHCMVHVNPYKS